MEEAETALAAEVPTPAEQDGATPDARASGVRSVVLRNGMKASSQDEAMHAEMLATFRTTADPAIAIRLWYGDRADDLARDPARLKVALARDIAELDDAMTEMLNAVLHHDRFQRLEAIWRGAALVVDAAEDSENVRIRILNARWAEMARDLERAVEFDQSSLFQKVYGDEFDMPGGTPYGMLVVDHEVQHRPRPGRAADDLSTLAGLAQIGQSAFSPVIIGCSPALFGLETFREFGLPIDLKAVLKQAEYQRFNRFRDSEEARFVGLVVPRVLLRLPYTQAPETNVGFPYREDRFGMGLSDHLWGNAGFAFATVLIRAFGHSRWFADIRGVQRDQIGGGLVTCLPVASFATESPGMALKYGTDVSITDRVEKDLDDLGFIALTDCKDTPYAVFYGSQSAHFPVEHRTSAARANERLSAMLRYTFCVSRFAHYLKIMVRERIGRFTTAEEIENDLHHWLLQYSTGNDDAPLEVKARYPLREASCQVRDVPGRAGSYRCIVHLKPHFQLDDVVSSFRLVTDLTAIGTRQ